MKGRLHMKLLSKAILCSFFISCLLSMTGFCGVCENLQNDVFRLHILANSDTEQDQNLKLQIRDGILAYTSELFQNCRTREEAIAAAENHLKEIQLYGQTLVHEYGYNYTVDAYVTKMNFDTRIYDDFTLPAGTYDALRIVIGQGKGHNWWCVLYPTLCVPSAQENQLENVLDQNEIDVISQNSQYEIKFKVVEIFENICSFFHR